MKSSIITPLVAAVLFGLIVLLMYAAVQQACCTTANNQQRGVARDMNHIKYARTYHFLSDSGEVEVQQGHGTFMQLYNKNGQLIYSGGTINVKAPRLTAGVWDNARQQTESTLTWQPAPTMQLAAVARYTAMPDVAFVVVARSLQEVENCEIRLITMIILFWAVGCGFIAMHWLAQRSIK
jgi:hypothetical protein